MSIFIHVYIYIYIQVMIIDSDLEGSTGLKVIHQKFPDVFVQSGIMERANLQVFCLVCVYI